MQLATEHLLHSRGTSPSAARAALLDLANVVTVATARPQDTDASQQPYSAAAAAVARSFCDYCNSCVSFACTRP
ncbi:hypothetical protein CTA1_12299 [Colletotrichum tanaceti]|uniref:Uncharacterized protein n=1 Tax=Colletotrichum tanaceti TaxID=1306861 RepID=A0A4U6XHU2_9PEZI|nr:hypothetical protein CTA1_12299 [Colletotrichum tanaceti]